MKIFTGIGPRETPDDILGLMYGFGTKLANLGYILRSGGASGADSIFETACYNVYGKKEIYLPWHGFNNNDSMLFMPSPEAHELAASVHSGWPFLTPAAKKLHARNCHQVLGADLKTPSRFVVCWTKGGMPVGGTATAIKLAIRNKIPVYNLFLRSHIDALNQFINNEEV